MAKVRGSSLLINASSVESMLNLHASVLADVDLISPGRGLGKVVLHPHIHVECLIGLLLAVLDAFHLRFILWGCEVEINTVLVALLEENLGESMLLERSLFIVWVAGPISS